MSKNKHANAENTAQTVTEVAPAAPEVSLPSPQAVEPQGDAPAVVDAPVMPWLGTVTEVAPEAPAAAAAEPGAPVATAAPAPRAFTVEIPQCLLRSRTFVAKDADDALRLYKELGGITSHVYPAKVDELPAGSPGHIAAVKAWEDARANEAEAAAKAKK